MFATRQLLLQKSCSWSKAQLIKFHRSSSFESTARNWVPLIRFRDKKKTDKSCGKIIRRRCSSFEWMMMRRPITSREMMETIICISWQQSTKCAKKMTFGETAKFPLPWPSSCKWHGIYLGPAFIPANCTRLPFFYSGKLFTSGQGLLSTN